MDFIKEAEELFSYTQELRRDFHAHPELGFQETRTAGIVASQLRDLGLETTTGVGKTGVVAMLEGEAPGPVVMLRFDMDALPIMEENQVEYVSQNPGVMHACGHDGHTAIGLTVARMLHKHREQIAGTIKFVFQPAEEGLGGAEAMVKDGVLDNPRPDYCLGLHLWNEKPLGWLGATPGAVMAASEIFNVRIIGKGGHGASPQLTVDPVTAAAQVVSGLQSIVSRNVAPLEAAVVSVTSVKAGEAFNVIPSEATLKGTIRTYQPEVRQLVIERFRQVVEGIANGMGCQAVVDIEPITPAVHNDAALTSTVTNVMREMLPDDEFSDSTRTMGSEDMAFFQQEVPGCYFFIGSNNAEAGLNFPHHHPRFDVDERALPRASAIMAEAALRVLHQI